MKKCLQDRSRSRIGGNSAGASISSEAVGHEPALGQFRLGQGDPSIFVQMEKMPGIIEA